MNKESIKKISKVKLVEYEQGKLKLVVENKDGSLVFSKKVITCNREQGQLTIELEDDLTTREWSGDHTRVAM